MRPISDVRQDAAGGLRVVEVRHPAVATRLARLRDREQPRDAFRRDLAALGRDLVYETARSAPVPGVVVPILRAGLGFLAGALEVLREADCGFLGLRRDEATLEASAYAEQLPASLPGRDVLVLEPMVATGGSLAHAVRLLADRGASTVSAVSAVVTPEAIERLGSQGGLLTLVCAAVDEGLDDRGYIRPGIGDAGDRLFGPR